MRGPTRVRRVLRRCCLRAMAHIHPVFLVAQSSPPRERIPIHSNAHHSPDLAPLVHHAAPTSLDVLLRIWQSTRSSSRRWMLRRRRYGFTSVLPHTYSKPTLIPTRSLHSFVGPLSHPHHSRRSFRLLHFFHSLTLFLSVSHSLTRSLAHSLILSLLLAPLLAPLLVPAPVSR